MTLAGSDRLNHSSLNLRHRWGDFISDPKQYRNVGFTALKEHQWETDSELKCANITLINMPSLLSM